MFGLTTLGTIHTAISLIALGAGFVALARYREISNASRSGATLQVLRLRAGKAGTVLLLADEQEES